MSPRTVTNWLSIVVAASLCLLAVGYFFYQRTPAVVRDFSVLRGVSRPNVVVITVDTLRADHVGAYGFEEALTPTIDSLARSGVLFTRASATVPLTLPSHTSLFSGMYPLRHGVRDNSNFAVPEDLTMMAEIFREGGYQTAAFVGAFVVDSTWGLDQGFETYFDDFNVPRERVVFLGYVQRTAEEVVEAAIDWLDEQQEAPFFLWVHLYDPHDPYDPPEPYRSRYPGKPYIGEIAYTDSQIRRLVGRLRQGGRMDNTFVVLAADHGESLEEHGEPTHGLFVYEEATHVPLIFSVPYEQLHGLRRRRPVSLVDVLPTVLEMTGLEAPAGVQGESLVSTFFDEEQTESPRGPQEYLYTESYYGLYNFGWSQLQSIHDGRYKLILSSSPELYDLESDPEESVNLVGERNMLFAQMNTAAEELIAQWSEGAEEQRVELDEEARQRLASLGYLGGSGVAVEADAGLVAPRDKIVLYRKLMNGWHLMRGGRNEAAATVLAQVLEEDPGVIEAYRTLGTVRSRLGQHLEAAKVFKRAIAYRPDRPEFFLLLADEQINSREFAAAEQTLKDSLSAMPPEAKVLYMLGNISRVMRKNTEAIRYYSETIALDPEFASAHTGLAGVYTSLEQTELALEQADRALAIDDATPNAHFTKALIYRRDGQTEKAIQEHLLELEASPDHFLSLQDLSLLYRENADHAKEERYLKETIRVGPQVPRSYLSLARLYLQQGRGLEKGVQLVEAALQKETIQPEGRRIGYLLLADLHGQLGNPTLAQQYAGRADQLGRDRVPR